MIGSLTERVKFQSPNIRDNGRGGRMLDKANPIVIGERWAAVTWISNQETLKYKGISAEANLYLEIREEPLINNGCQAIVKNPMGQLCTVEIIEIAPAKKRGYWRLYCREAVKNGQQL